ncbi:hypothetical protein V6N13_049453 [Hibiscus sabdariffa]|uniref:Uncharacterized protein n=1 Tax=Hibiscus sabdariffa TaxID=183260 RepID=A0ABR2QX89_9ROSI
MMFDRNRFQAAVEIVPGLACDHFPVAAEVVDDHFALISAHSRAAEQPALNIIPISATSKKRISPPGFKHFNTMCTLPCEPSRQCIIINQIISCPNTSPGMLYPSPCTFCCIKKFEIEQRKKIAQETTHACSISLHKPNTSPKIKQDLGSKGQPSMVHSSSSTLKAPNHPA